MKGNVDVFKVHYKGEEDDFIVFVESVEDYKKWKNDRTIPLASVVNSFKIFITHKSVFLLTLLHLTSVLTFRSQGAQGQMDGVSKSTLENEFGTKNEDEAIIKILERGELQVSEVGWDNPIAKIEVANYVTELRSRR